MAVHPFDPNEIKTVPEPSTALVFVAGLVGWAGWGSSSQEGLTNFNAPL